VDAKRTGCVKKANILATEEGIVTKVYSSTAWVKCSKCAACESCSAKGFCDSVGGGSEDDLEVEAINVAGARANDRVTISFKTSSLLKVSFLVYMVPVLFFILGVIIGTCWFFISICCIFPCQNKRK